MDPTLGPVAVRGKSVGDQHRLLPTYSADRLVVLHHSRNGGAATVIETQQHLEDI